MTGKAARESAPASRWEKALKPLVGKKVESVRVDDYGVVYITAAGFGGRIIAKIGVRAPASQDAPGVMLTVAGKRFACQCGANVFSKVNGEYRCNGCPRNYESLDAPEADDD